MLLLGVFIFVQSSFAPCTCGEDEWGFFGHRRINRMAVFTLPPQMIKFYKKNIEYITDHAVDPDKRRYATKHEAVRHYVDIDHWDSFPFNEVPRKFTDALVKYSDLFVITEAKDTLHLFGKDVAKVHPGFIRMKGEDVKTAFGKDSLDFPYEDYHDFFRKYCESQYYEDDWIVKPALVDDLFKKFQPKFKTKKAYAVDEFSGYGILPYHLPKVQRQLTEAFATKNTSRILRISAEIGHYIGDAHVPLHTTENYNGQLTNQNGIHGFWESRIPELFADKTFDYFVGKAEYWDDPSKTYWDVVLKSHSHVDSVLLIEKDLSKIFPQDKQYCYEKRLESTVLVPCTAYADAFNKRMNGMVEERMRASIRAIGSAWFTAWVDAGQPDLNDFDDPQTTREEKKRMREEEKLFKQGKSKGRQHGS